MPFALCAMGLLTLVFSGCRKEEAKPPAVDRAAPESYMNDAAFRKSLSDARKSLQALAVERKALADRMQALAVAHRENAEELKKIPEWNELHAKLTALDARYKALRRGQLETVRDRLSPKKEISK